VIDSPNRDVTGPLGWSHPEHTIEFTPAEAAELVTLAGFDVTSVRGVWLCREPGTGEPLNLWDSPDAPELTRRTLLATDHPEDSFVWWLEATNTAREPDIEGLRRRHAEIFALAWPERQQRLKHVVGEQHQIDGDPVVSVPVGSAGAAMHGPDMPFAPGHYTATVWLRRRGTGEIDGELATADVYTADGTVHVSRTLTSADLPPDVWTAIPLEFDVAEIAWGGQFRVVSTGVAAIDVRLHVELSEVGTRVAPSQLAGN